MNLLTLQICKEEANSMFNHPREWANDYENDLNEAILSRIIRQGGRTLEVIKAYENSRGRRRLTPHRR